MGLVGVIATAASAADAIFPSPLHLTRRISDPLSRTTSVVVEEYYGGSRAVTISGTRTVIVDYASQQLTEIDRSAGTYSVIRFDEIAQAHPRLKAAERGTADQQRRVVPLGRRPSARGAAVDTFEISSDASAGRRVIGLDTSMSVSRAAFDVLAGASYPGEPSPDHDAIVAVAGQRGSRIRSDAASGGDDAEYALPVEQTDEFEEAGQIVSTSNVIVRIGTELPPLELLAIPPGAKRVEPRQTAVPRALRELDRLPARPTP